MIIRPYTPNDLNAVAAIYRDAVFGIGTTAYSAEQASVWASFPDDREAFSALLGKGFALIAEIDGAPAAFCHLHPMDHISLLYTATRHAREVGVLRGLLAHAGRNCAVARDERA